MLARDSVDSTDLLSKYDRELSEVLEKERQRGETQDEGRIIAPIPRRENQLTNWYPQDWRVPMIFCVLLVVLVPVIISQTDTQVL